MPADPAPVCGYCGCEIASGVAALDPRGAANDGSQRLVHPHCEKPFWSEILRSREQQAKGLVRSLLAAASRVWTAYLDYGPVNDGRPEGAEFTAALDALMTAAVDAGAEMPPRKRRRKAKGANHAP